ncbi:pentatricopeptide repeat-containing protein At4g21705, mitochondrial-like [Wolffia australiana]
MLLPVKVIPSMIAAARRGRCLSVDYRLRRVCLLTRDGNGDGRSYSSSRSARRSTLLSAILPMGHPSVSLVPELETWAKNQRKIFPGELQDLVKELRSRKRFKQALEVSEWTNSKEIFRFNSGDHAIRLDLIGQVRGVEHAESYFHSLNEELKTQKTHGALLNCYVREGQIEESLRQMENMKALGFVSTALPYNNLMSLFTQSGQLDRIPPVLAEMKKNRILPDNLSYRLCINSYGARNLISKMEETLEEMDCQPQIVIDWSTYALVSHIYNRSGIPEKASAAARKSEEKMNKKAHICYNHLISLHGAMKNKSEMWRLWNLQEQAGLKHLNRDYTIMLGELVKLGELEEAECLLKNWEISGNTADFRVAEVVLAGYCNSGEVEKGEKMIKDLGRRGRAVALPSSWGILARGFAHEREMNKARSYLEEALRGYEPGGAWRPSLRLILSVLEWIRDSGREIEDFAQLLKPVVADHHFDEESKRKITKILNAFPNR